MSSITNSAIEFYVGSALTVNNSVDLNTNANSKVFFNLNNVNGPFAIRTLRGNGPNVYAGKKQVKWYINGKFDYVQETIILRLQFLELNTIMVNGIC